MEPRGASGPPRDELTPERLSPVLAARLGPGTTCTGVRRGAVGNAQETWFVDARDGEGRERALVLRRSAAGSTLRWTERGTEFEVLGELAEAGLPTPRVLWLDESEELKRPYLVMERLPGAPVGRDAGERRAVAEQLGVLLARLHGRPPVPEADGVRLARAELGRWRERYEAERPGPVPLLGALLAWLEATVPGAPAPGLLLWGDPGPHNVLVEEGRVSAMLDWELSHAGHPLDDLGAAVWACLDVLDPELLVTAYEDACGAPVDRAALDWFVVLACVSRSVMLLAGVRDWVAGRIGRPSVVGLGQGLLTANLERAARQAGWPEASAAARMAAEDGDWLTPSVGDTVRGIAAFLERDVRQDLGDRDARRALKQAIAVLEAAALRSDADVSDREAVAALLSDLREAGVATAGLEDAARAVERDPALAAWRPRVRALLLADLARYRVLLEPLRPLYERG